MNRLDDGRTAFTLLALSGGLFLAGVTAACFGNWTVLELWLLLSSLADGWLWLHF